VPFRELLEVDPWFAVGELEGVADDGVWEGSRWLGLVSSVYRGKFRRLRGSLPSSTAGTTSTRNRPARPQRLSRRSRVRRLQCRSSKCRAARSAAAPRRRAVRWPWLRLRCSTRCGPPTQTRLVRKAFAFRWTQSGMRSSQAERRQQKQVRRTTSAVIYLVLPLSSLCESFTEDLLPHILVGHTVLWPAKL
jgi:hypothetical protein